MATTKSLQGLTNLRDKLRNMTKEEFAEIKKEKGAYEYIPDINDKSMRWRIK